MSQFNQPIQTKITPDPQPKVSIKPSLPRWSLILLIIAGIIIGIVGYAVYQYFGPILCTKDARTCPDGSSVGRIAPDCEFAECPEVIDPTANWQTYTNSQLGISFKYPNGWYVEENTSINRIYIRNVQGGASKANMPSNFQQVWISTWEQEINVETENNVKSGNPDDREFEGSLLVGTINRNDFVINTYEYKTIGGSTLQAFWSNKSGKRYYATNSTEVGIVNQRDMIANLKKILSTFKFID